MKITYNKNPLCTTVELDDFEKKELWYKIKVKELEEAMGSASLYLDPKNASWVMKPSPGRNRPEPHTLETLIAEVRKNYLDMEYFYTDGKSKLDEYVDRLHESYLAELTGYHCGDCTCVAMTCFKCVAEEIVGVETLKGLGKHSAYKIDAAFGKQNEKSIDEALAALGNYDPGPYTGTNPKWTQADHDRCVPRWKVEGKAAYEWLLNYRKTHYKDQE